MKKISECPISKPECHTQNYLRRPKLKKLVITEIKNNYFRAHLMTRRNEGETWQTSWKVEGSARKVKRTLININFL